jgi:hypothetical protein
VERWKEEGRRKRSVGRSMRRVKSTIGRKMYCKCRGRGEGKGRRKKERERRKEEGGIENGQGNRET